jgi:hypothetical protein
MLDPDVREIGVGVARSNKTGRYYAVEDFGRPLSAQKNRSCKVGKLSFLYEFE